MTLLCPYCESPAKLVSGKFIYPHLPDLFGKWFWHCAPCQAHVGCHPNGTGKKPLGTLANYALRIERSHTHRMVDAYWKRKYLTRRQVYARLSALMAIDKTDCHIGQFTIEQCKVAQALASDSSLWLHTDSSQSIAKETT